MILKKQPNAGVSHANKLKIASREAVKYQDYHEDWALSLPEKQVAKWGEQLSQWEDDHSALNPYEKQFKSEFRIYFFFHMLF